MLLVRTERFKKDYRRVPPEIRRRVAKALEQFVRNLRHPSLHVKKMEGAPDLWELRVSDTYRITFQFLEDGVLLRHLGTHDILRHP